MAGSMDMHMVAVAEIEKPVRDIVAGQVAGSRGARGPPWGSEIRGGCVWL
jgi:hypothetical protein